MRLLSTSTLPPPHPLFHLTPPPKASSYTAPKLHSVWANVMDEALVSSTGIQDVWTTIIDSMFVGTPEKLYMAYQVVEAFLPRIPPSKVLLRPLQTVHVTMALSSQLTSSRPHLSS